LLNVDEFLHDQQQDCRFSFEVAVHRDPASEKTQDILTAEGAHAMHYHRRID
jgi:hypothetical protein